MIITGNPKEGLAKALYKIYPNAVFCSRETGADLTVTDHMFQFANECTKHDIIILNSAFMALSSNCTTGYSIQGT